ncbi:PHD finger protein ING1-like [Dioscorea cayenensis subsp. rotundata]|uniref:PHD finger protein ING n=1 Tax=Dioscorea cayennensis subsp. rotundata TaxID=55577 RepID=A0AB40CDX0_DIOCR|nr:PHD finger protein ING1-like [Dioscorea cayenensis subsp. rotundata]
MGFMEDFQASLESLPAMLQRNYSMMRDLDKSFQGVQRQNEQRCEQEMENIKRGVESGNITPDSSLIRFSDEALEEQKHCIRIADEKVALAVQAYDIVDAHIQQLDQYMRKLEEIRKGFLFHSFFRNFFMKFVPFPINLWLILLMIYCILKNTTRSGRISESSRGGRKKTRLAAAAAVEPISMDLELPVDPNEPTYCFCNQVSFGEMVACDNPDCKIEWFHFGCVGLKEHPKGKWYCSNCSGMQKRRKGK